MIRGFHPVIVVKRKVVPVVVRYLIAVALLHASRGARSRPRLQVIYGLNNVDNDNSLECIDCIQL